MSKIEINTTDERNRIGLAKENGDSKARSEGIVQNAFKTDKVTEHKREKKRPMDN